MKTTEVLMLYCTDSSYYQTVNVGLEPHDLRRGPITLDRGAHEYTGSSGYSQKQGHRGWMLIKGNRKRKALSVKGMGPSKGGWWGMVGPWCLESGMEGE